ncbi:hypothetical protein [Caulobacter segnis]|uniref:Uncharacterized protein n=2 Tax=Caulobacter segnis TaxID=88688 RepID=D5VPH7_CAUST|nr:hypothetical protein [Caulobacter segnis]ADG12400.1 conserved hypothetical protein [Caulobacter segnis ATCC 21756]
MTAIACLKIFVGEDLRFGDADAMAALVAKVAGAYLESSWTWPRRYGLVAPYAFVLADPRATRLDARELQKMARDLQVKMFGDKGAGEVALLMFEGDQTDVMRFASAHDEALKALLSGEAGSDFAGRICKITPDVVTSVQPPGGPLDGAPPAAELAAIEPEPPLDGIGALLDAPRRNTGWWGIYYLAKERFVGSGVDWRLAWDEQAFGALEHADMVAHDLACLEAAQAQLRNRDPGYIFLPFSFSSLVKPSVREIYQGAVSRFPRALSSRLAASVYDVPREPSYGAIAQIRGFLNPNFSLLDLHVRDPGFRIDSLSVGVVHSVTLVLEGDDERVRLAAITRFLKDAPVYRAKRVWQGVAMVNSLKELDLCRRLKAPFLSGPMVAPLTSKPTGEVAIAPERLPYRAKVERVRDGLGA